MPKYIKMGHVEVGHPLLKTQKNDTITSSKYLQLRELIDQLSFDYQRMSQSGQEIYDEIYNLCQLGD